MRNNINKLALVSLLCTSSALASDTFINSLGINLGVSSSPYSKKDNLGSIASNNPDESFNHIELFTVLNPLSNICKENNMKPYISYTYSNNDDININISIYTESRQ